MTQAQLVGALIAGAVILHYIARKDWSDAVSEVIPVDEPTLVNWTEQAGEMFFT